MSRLVFAATSGPGVQALEYAAAKGHDVTLLHSPEYDFFIDDDQRERAFAAADRTLFFDDLRRTDDVVAALRAADVRPDALFSTLSLATLQAATIAEAVGARGTSTSSVSAARDKVRCREIVRAAGLPNVGFAGVTTAAQAHEAARDIGFPVIIKPACGVGKVVTTVARSAADIDAHFARADALTAGLEAGVAAELDGRFVLEELVSGRLYSVEVAADGEVITPLLVVRRKTGTENTILELGSSVPCGLPDDQVAAINDYAVAVCRALGMNLGFFHVELIRTADGPRLVEVNPRIAGGAIPDLARAATNQNLFHLLVDLYAGLPAPRKPLPVVAAASHSFLTAAQDCRVREDLSADWFEQIRPRIHSGWSDITPGASLAKMGTNFDVRGVVRVVRNDSVALAEDECLRLTAEIEEILGIRLAAGAVR